MSSKFHKTDNHISIIIIALAYFFILCIKVSFAQENNSIRKSLDSEKKNIAQIAILNKQDTSVNIYDFDLTNPKPLLLKDIVISVKTCHEIQSQYEEYSAFVIVTKIDDIKSSDKNDNIFSGWMYSESRTVSSLEDPIYEVWLKGCKDKVSENEEKQKN